MHRDTTDNHRANSPSLLLVGAALVVGVVVVRAAP
jgi:hypothetical protein